MPRSRLRLLADGPDKRVLECAVTGHADLIVTGDRAMLALSSVAGIRIGPLRTFLDMLGV